MNRRRDFSLPRIVLDRASRHSLQRQIHDQIAAAIRSGAIGRDARLPSTRLMARLLCVSRNTVLAAYDDLVAEELIRGEPGAGMRVNGGAPVTALSLPRMLREARYPARIMLVNDMDANPLYISY